jgi:hypothetical protein
MFNNPAGFFFFLPVKYSCVIISSKGEIVNINTPKGGIFLFFRRLFFLREPPAFRNSSRLRPGCEVHVLHILIPVKKGAVFELAVVLFFALVGKL